MDAYPTERTGLLLVDPYNDFLAEAGKLTPRAKPVMDRVGTIGNMQRIVAAARGAGIRVFYVPHHRARPGDFAAWRHPTPYQQGADRAQVFAEGEWGSQWHSDFAPQPGDVFAKEHWSSGFAGTDLDLQLRQHGVERIVLIGLLANTCLEATGRYGMELGYHVTLVRDATAAFSDEAMRCAHDINGPTYAHAIVDTNALLASFPQPLAA